MFISKKNLLFFSSFLLVSISLAQQITNRDVEAIIDTTSLDGVYIFKAIANNKTQDYKSLSYNFSIIKNSKKTNNSSKNKQEDLFVLDPNQRIALSTFTTNFFEDENDEIIAFLLIYEKEKLIGKNRIVISEELLKLQQQNKVDKSEEDADNVDKEQPIEADYNSVEITGLVLDETKTKFGREFYEFFSTLYNQNNINGELPVSIQEIFSLGRRTIIEVFVGDVIVNRFLVQPDVEYLNENAEQTIYNVKKQFYRLKQTRDSLEEY